MKAQFLLEPTLHAPPVIFRVHFLAPWKVQNETHHLHLPEPHPFFMIAHNCVILVGSHTRQEPQPSGSREARVPKRFCHSASFCSVLQAMVLFPISVGKTLFFVCLLSLFCNGAPRTGLGHVPATPSGPRPKCLFTQTHNRSEQSREAAVLLLLPCVTWKPLAPRERASPDPAAARLRPAGCTWVPEGCHSSFWFPCVHFLPSFCM